MTIKDTWDSIFGHKTKMIDSAGALPGRESPPFEISDRHAVLGTTMTPPFPEHLQIASIGLGCFWGAEQLFWELEGVWTTAVGYAGGFTPNPTYEEVCSGKTGDAEAVLVAFDPSRIGYEELLKVFFEAHDPTQGMRQQGDIGTQYRSIVFVHDDAQREAATRVLASYDRALQEAGNNPVTTEIVEAGPFYYAEEYHQQYLHKVPNGYCGLKGTGVACAISPMPVSGGDHESVVEDTGLKPIPETEDEWKQMLGPERYKVLREAGTERPFTGHYNAVWEEGTYRCGACGNPLFDSTTKYDHGCGWPSFGEALPGAVEHLEDRSYGMVRTEVRCARCHSHLGHIFNDGPREYNGARFCMNSIAMDLDRS